MLFLPFGQEHSVIVTGLRAVLCGSGGVGMWGAGAEGRAGARAGGCSGGGGGTEGCREGGAGRLTRGGWRAGGGGGGVKGVGMAQATPWGR